MKQRRALIAFVGTGPLVAGYTEVESGRRHTNRPQLLAALAECRKRRAVSALLPTRSGVLRLL